MQALIRSSAKLAALPAHYKRFAQQFKIWQTVLLGLTYLTATTVVSKACSLNQANAGSSTEAY